MYVGKTHNKQHGNLNSSYHICGMFESEIYFKTSRSSGSGGQNVNKVSTKVELNFDVLKSKLLTEEQKQKIFEKLSNRINKEGVLKVTAESSRSQLENKKFALDKFNTLITECFKEKKKRIKTKASRTSKEKRIKLKKITSERKVQRKKISW
ncbi:MAG TPA: alternative ribosome rescue aminoacyl-tRNA hydrolase ArfB [Bacteroidia bacterium]|nr:alternative ribosome rescue aminoacyl-tRNA hydrolase ArfB [Bacteroidia bacterium]